MSKNVDISTRGILTPYIELSVSKIHVDILTRGILTPYIELSVSKIHVEIRQLIGMYKALQ